MAKTKTTVKVKGTPGKSKAQKHKAAEEAMERLSAFHKTGLDRLREDFQAIQNQELLDHKDVCKTCRCASTVKGTFRNAEYTLNDLEHYLGAAFGDGTGNAPDLDYDPDFDDF